MTKMKHFAGAFIIFATLVSLFAGIWSGFVEEYDIVETNNIGGESIMQRLAGINMIEGINNLNSAIYRITSPSNVFDLLGALASAGTALLQTIGGIVTLPLEIFDAIWLFYPGGIPPIVSTMLGTLVTLYFGFALLQAYTRTDA